MIASGRTHRALRATLQRQQNAIEGQIAEVAFRNSDRGRHILAPDPIGSDDGALLDIAPSQGIDKVNEEPLGSPILAEVEVHHPHASLFPVSNKRM